MVVPVLVHFKKKKANVQLALFIGLLKMPAHSFLSFYVFYILPLDSILERFFRKWLSCTWPSQPPDMLIYSLCSLQEVSRVSTLLASSNVTKGPNVRLGKAGLQAFDKTLFCFFFIPQRNSPLISTGFGTITYNIGCFCEIL